MGEVQHPDRGEGQRRVDHCVDYRRSRIFTQKSSTARIDAAIGGIGGFAGGLLGVGGGFILVPLQVLWKRTEQHTANGTSLAAILPMALLAAARYYFGSGTPQTDLTVAFYLGAGGIVGALVGAMAARRISDTKLKMIVSVVLVVVGVKEVYDAVVGTAPHLVSSGVPALGPKDYALIAVGGVAVGIVSGLTGVGGGILVVPLLTLGFAIGQRVAQGTSLIAILPIGAIGALTYHRSGNVDLRAVTWMAVAGVPAAVLGASLALWLPQRALGGLFGAFLVFAALRTWPLGSPPHGGTTRAS